MRPDVQRDLGWSAKVLLARWPEIQKVIPLKGELHSIESAHDARVCEALDWYAGVDAYVVDRDGRAVYPLAARVQQIKPAHRPFESFTIRAARANGEKTEVEKRLESDGNPYALGPSFTLQVYVEEIGSALLAFGGVFTEDLFKFYRNHPDLMGEKKNPEDNNLFKVAWWNHLRHHKLQVFSWVREGTRTFNGPYIPAGRKAATHETQGNLLPNRVVRF
jgi:hypothetical protein